MPAETCRIGVDLGGTKIEAVALCDDGREAIRRRVATPRDDYEGTVAAIAQLVETVAAAAPCAQAVGIGIPGAVSPATGLVKNANSVCLIGHRLDADLAAAMNRPVRLANDANCFALSEAADGAAAGFRTVFGAILGTGVGGGVAIDGAPIAGVNAVAGEWGHNPLPWPEADELPGAPCFCGKRGCIETFLSGPGLSADHERRTGNRLPAAEIASRARGGDAACADTMTRYLDRLARALATVINLLDPEVVVFGGGVSNIDAIYEGLPSRLPAYVFSGEVTTTLVRARHGDSSGVRGAARLWPAEAQQDAGR